MPHFTRSSAKALRRSLGQSGLENGANLKILVFLSKIVTKKVLKLKLNLFECFQMFQSNWESFCLFGFFFSKTGLFLRIGLLFVWKYFIVITPFVILVKMEENGVTTI